MRFSLRNQKKISGKLGQKYLDILLTSLVMHFTSTNEIEEHTYEGEDFKVIHVPNAQPKTDSVFEFYVISKTFDVYNLAYKSTIG
jgi:hypothetical protein